MGQLPSTATTRLHPAPALLPSPRDQQCFAGGFTAAQQEQTPSPCLSQGTAGSSELLLLPLGVLHNLHGHEGPYTASSVSRTNTAQRKHRPDHDPILTVISKPVKVLLRQMRRGAKHHGTNVCDFRVRLWRLDTIREVAFFPVPAHSGRWVHREGYRPDLTRRIFQFLIHNDTREQKQEIRFISSSGGTAVDAMGWGISARRGLQGGNILSQYSRGCWKNELVFRHASLLPVCKKSRSKNASFAQVQKS